MKLCAKYSLLVLVLAAIFCGHSLFAMDPVIRNELYKEQVKCFDKVESIVNVTLASDTVITPSDTVSTYTADVAYLSGSYSYPIELEIQVHGAKPLYYGLYSTNASGTSIPDAGEGAVLMDVNGAKCVSDKHAKMIFYRRPNLSFSPGSDDAATTSATFIIRTLKDTEY
ncbi:MAG: hypothetical protein PHQ02_04475 [Candidatus Riflebacteria bacterium]|nr:hypothetical protein [Candidatus Riflebacteria bacterium]